MHENNSLDILSLNNDVDGIKRLLHFNKNNGVANDSYDIHKCFMNACENGNVEICRLLLEYEGPNNVNKYNVMTYSFKNICEKGYIDIVKLIIQNKTKEVNIHIDNEYAFTRACSNGHIELVKFLLSLEGDDRIDIHSYYDIPFRYSCSGGQINVINFLLSLDGDRRVNVHACDEWSLRSACFYGRLEVVKLLLSLDNDRYVDVHAFEESAFKLSCESGKLEVLKFLLSLEGDRKINIHDNINNIKYSFERAIYGKHIKIIKVLMKLINNVGVNFLNDYWRKELLIILIKDIRKNIRINKVRKNKTLMLKEIKCLPSNHIFKGFGGGSDYIKMLNKYSN